MLRIDGARDDGGRSECCPFMRRHVTRRAGIVRLVGFGFAPWSASSFRERIKTLTASYLVVLSLVSFWRRILSPSGSNSGSPETSTALNSTAVAAAKASAYEIA